MVRLCFLFGLLCAVVANAEEVATEVDARSAIDRPMLLPLWRVQAEVATGGGAHPSPSGDKGGVFSEVALSVGLPRNWQVGVYWRQAFQNDFTGSSQAAAAMANLQHAFTPWMGARVDVGAASSSTATDYEPSFGLGIPLRYRFDEHFALISGQTEGRGIGSLSGDGDWATFTPSQDLFTMRQVSPRCFLAQSSFKGGPGVPGFTTGCGSGWYGTSGLPVGILFQPRPGIALSLRSGVRCSFAIDTGGTPGPGLPLFIPVGVRALFSPWSNVDLGIEVQTAGTPTALGADRSGTVWTQVRL
jgi:hypothetical protein